MNRQATKENMLVDIDGRPRSIIVSFHDQQRPHALLLCMAGGGMTHGYFDLASGYSFADLMMHRGYALCMLDQPGVGDNQDGPLGACTDPRVAALATAQIARQAAARVNAPPFGIGHSMGGSSIVLAHAAGAAFHGLVLLGADAAGVPEALSPDERAYTDRPEALRRDLPALVKRRAAQPQAARSPEQGLRQAGMTRRQFAGDSEAADAALRAVRARMYWPGAVTSMVPGSFRQEAASIDAPILAIRGEHDLCAPLERARRDFTSAPMFEIHELPNTGHNHFAERDALQSIADLVDRFVLGVLQFGRDLQA